VSTVEGSLSSAGSGGGIYGTQCGVRLVNSRLAGNTADSNGGGATLQQCLAVFDKSVVENNQVSRAAHSKHWGSMLCETAKAVGGQCCT